MMRTSLASISGNRNRYYEYSSFQRDVIARVVSHEVISYRINKLYRIPLSSIKIIVFNALICYNDNSKLRSKKSKKLSIRNRRHILRIVRLNFKIIYKNLVAKINIFVSHNTLYRILKEKSIIN